MNDDPKKPEDLPEDEFSEDSFDEGLEEYDEFYEEDEALGEEGLQEDEFSEEGFSEEDWDDDGFHDEFEEAEADESLYDDNSKKKLSSNTIIIIAAVIVGFGFLVWQVVTKGAAVQQVERFVSAVGMTGLADNPIFNTAEKGEDPRKTPEEADQERGFLNDPRLLSKDQDPDSLSQVAVVEDAPPMPAPISPVEEGDVPQDSETPLTPMPSSSQEQNIDRNLTNTVTSKPQNKESDIPEYAPPRGPQDQGPRSPGERAEEDMASQETADNTQAAEEILRAAIAKRQQNASSQSSDPETQPSPSQQQGETSVSEENESVTDLNRDLISDAAPKSSDQQTAELESVTAGNEMPGNLKEPAMDEGQAQPSMQMLEAQGNEQAPSTSSAQPEPISQPEMRQASGETAEQIQTISGQLEKVIEKIEDLDIKVTQVREETNLKISQMSQEIDRIENRASQAQPAQKTAPRSTSTRTEAQKAQPEQASSRAPARPAVPETKPDRPAASAQRTASTTIQWELRAAQPGKAWVSQPGRQDIRSVEIGDTLPGLGRITAVNYSAGRWIVQGTRGRLVQ